VAALLDSLVARVVVVDHEVVLGVEQGCERFEVGPAELAGGGGEDVGDVGNRSLALVAGGHGAG
jgi:hypothetical protein